MSERETALNRLVEMWRKSANLTTMDGQHAYEVCAQDLAIALLAHPEDASQAGADPVPVCQWREIATAPKEPGQLLLLWWPSRFRTPVDGWWNGARWQGTGDEDDSDGEPTHWMPLPAPPVALVPAEGDR